MSFQEYFIRWVYFLRLLRIVELNIIRHMFRALLKFAFAKIEWEDRLISSFCRIRPVLYSNLNFLSMRN